MLIQIENVCRFASSITWLTGFHVLTSRKFSRWKASLQRDEKKFDAQKVSMPDMLDGSRVGFVSVLMRR